MATGKSCYARPSYRFLPVPAGTGNYPSTATTDLPPDSVDFEFDESEIYNSGRSNSPEFLTPVCVSRAATKNSKKSSSISRDMRGGTPASLPVNIPDWSKILRDEYSGRRSSCWEDDDAECEGDGWCDDGGERVPPHEFLARQMARTRISSFSVYEGVGRTLKGRDLSRLRNAIWAKTGFQD